MALLTAAPSLWELEQAGGLGQAPNLFPVPTSLQAKPLSWNASNPVCGSGGFIKSSGLLQAIYHILIMIYDSIGFLKPTDFLSTNSAPNEDHQNSQDEVITTNYYVQTYYELL